MEKQISGTTEKTNENALSINQNSMDQLNEQEHILDLAEEEAQDGDDGFLWASTYWLQKYSELLHLNQWTKYFLLLQNE